MFSVACKNIVLSSLLGGLLISRITHRISRKKIYKRNARRTTEKEIKVKLIFQYPFWSTEYEFL